LKFRSSTTRVFLVLAVFWTSLIMVIAWFSYRQIVRTAWIIAVNNARDTFNRDLVYRRWATLQGGVYVPVSAYTPSNPHLSHIPERDVTTTGGKELTLVNPAYMTRQVQELGAQQYGLKGHITSLRPIRTANAPDDWEKMALQTFEESGIKEIISIDTIDGEEFLRFMQPMRTEQGCLKCHATQGYREGDIRGGISVSVPWKPVEQGIATQRSVLILAYGMIWLIGLGGIGYSGSLIRSLIRKKEKAEKDLVIQNEELRVANREKDNLMSVISHDLRSPFNAILGITGILARDATKMEPQDIQKMVDALQRSSTNVYRLLQNLLEWAQIQRGLSVCNPDYYLLKPLIESTIEMSSAIAIQKQVRIQPDIPNELDIYADEQMLSSILRNLLVNAIKFTPGGGEVKISAGKAEGKGVQLIIRDNGIGMASEISDHIFSFSDKRNRTGTSGEPSSGLGLVIVKEFMEKHGGRIQVESEEGKGTTFILFFPFPA